MFITKLIRSFKKNPHLGVDTKKSENFSRWYQQVLIKAELLEYHNIEGFYVIRPWAYSIWEAVQTFFDAEIKKLGVKNCYFPMFVSAAVLEHEKTHVADFGSEVAWVTKAGNTDLAEPFAIRPTSETMIYPFYAKWCWSHRDLPIKLNQWCNRWESRRPTPFLRAREFLWQEGHSAFATKEDAIDEVFTILDLYARIYTDLMAIPVVKGRKTEKEKFAGSDFTATVEAYVPANGRGIQGATSHHLGQNFSKMFNISFANSNKLEKREFAWQNSWGISTRSIGALIMVHGDDNGLVLPPKVAAIQVIVIPVGITAKTSEEDRFKLLQKASEVTATLVDAGIRSENDIRGNVTPGWKFNHWELKGVPIRLEIGPKDMEKQQAIAVLRYNGKKRIILLNELCVKIKEMLEEIHHGMFKKVEILRDEHMQICLDWEKFTPLLDKKMILLSPFCGRPQCETLIKDQSVRKEHTDQLGISQMGAKTLCIPVEQPKEVTLPEHCIYPDCKEKAVSFALFGRSY